MLTNFRRHVRSCRHRSRRYRRCSCPIHVEGTLAGEPIRKALDLTSWEAAENLVHEWNRAGRIGNEVRQKTPREAVMKFLADARARKLRDGTILLYEQTLLDQFVAWCEKQNIANVAHVDVERLRQYRETWNCAAVTGARRIDRLRTFFSFCVDSGWMIRNPAKPLKAPPARPKPRMPFTSDEVDAMLRACDGLVTHGTYGKENRARVKAFIYVLRFVREHPRDQRHQRLYPARPPRPHEHENDGALRQAEHRNARGRVARALVGIASSDVPGPIGYHPRAGKNALKTDHRAGARHNLYRPRESGGQRVHDLARPTTRESRIQGVE